ncbi:unnamed protein product [Schistocephalus solidus]|uniref:SH2 domain-containing protein n=1 Tax=Schistocephalus solidus TaxID=70667 RepID=A0A3P7ET10_SCHSO|nr:unnamed protein product [Schistocephalus solidus]
MTSGVDYVDCSSLSSEAILAFREQSFLQVSVQAIEENVVKDLSGDVQQLVASVFVAEFAIPFLLVELSFSTNLDQEAEGSPGNGLTPTENIARRLPPEGQNLPRRADRPLSSPGDMPESQASPHRLDSVMPDTDSPLPAEPPLSADATSGLTSVASVEAQPPSSQLRIRSPRGNHNLLASGVLSHPADVTLVVSLSSQQSPAAPASVQANQGAPEAAEEAGVETCDSNAVLPPMSRLLTDFDSLSTDSYEEAWDLRHGRVISQLTRTRFIDPEEVLSEVVNSGRQGIGFLGKGGSNRQQQQQSETSDQMLYPKSSLNNVVSAGDCAVLAALSPPISCQSSLVCQRNAPAYPSTPPELKPLHEQTWFHPSLSRSDAETCLRSEPDGSFLVRNSETNKNDFSLTIKHNGFLHMKISRNIHGKFILGEYSQPYASIPEMISHYERTRVPVRGADSVVLCHPR